MKKEIAAKRIEELERKLREAIAQQIHTAHFADRGLDGATMQKMCGGAVVITITALGGREIVAPTAIRGGLSDETIKALRADLVRTYNDAAMFKPRGA